MISVIIPCYNEEKYLGNCLRSLSQQTTNQPFEIIVVDNTSTDDTTQIAQQFSAALPLHVITEREKGRGAARDTGCRAAMGEIILTTDADGVVPGNWIDIMIAGFEDPAVVGVTGTCYIADQSWVANTVFNIIQPSITLIHRMVFGSFWVLGSNGGFRKSTYEKMGGYNRELNSQEDTQFSLQLQRYGKIKYIRNSRVQTSGRRFKRGMIAGLFEYVRSFIERFILRRKNSFLRDAR